MRVRVRVRVRVGGRGRGRGRVRVRVGMAELLPEPDGPHSASTEPGSTVRLTWLG